MTSTERIVETSEGPARLLIDRSRSGQPGRSGRPRTRATLVLGHGAGGGPEAVDLAALAAELPRHGIVVVRVEQPWRLAGKKVAPKPEALDRAWIGALTTLRPRVPLIVGGRSAGARVACRTARQLGAKGCLALAFPLHPPGKPEKSRSDELVDAGVPTLVVQGERDPFGAPPEFPAGTDLTVVPWAGHELTVPKRATITQGEAERLIIDTVARWLTESPEIAK